MAYLVGIDLGSTSLKAVVYDESGNAVAQGSRLTERFHLDEAHPDWTVWQPEQIWNGTAAALHDAVSKLDDPSKIEAVAVTGMGMDGLPMDADGNWLYPMISWLDARTAPQLQWWQENVGSEKTFSIGGNPVWAINSALRIRWMQENEPEILAKADKWLLIEDFVNFMLTGRRTTDYSMASCTMLFDQRTLNWSDEMLGLAGISRELMPEVLPSATPLGPITEEAARVTGLPTGTPVILGGHDHLCGNLPVGAHRPGVFLDVTGTWEIVTASYSEPMLTESMHQAGLTVQAHVASGVWAAWASTPAGECIEWYRKLYGSGDAGEANGSDWESLITAARQAEPGAGGVMFLPHLSGSTCPVVDPQSRGAFVGLQSGTSRDQMVRAVFEGMDFQFREIIGAMEAGLGCTAERIVAVGGATRNEFWMQNKADVAGRPVEVPQVEEATPLGAAILAGIGAGVYSDVDDALTKVYRPGRTYEPDPKLVEQYNELFERYQRVYPALKAIHCTGGVLD